MKKNQQINKHKTQKLDATIKKKKRKKVDALSSNISLFNIK